MKISGAEIAVSYSSTTWQLSFPFLPFISRSKSSIHDEEMLQGSFRSRFLTKCPSFSTRAHKIGLATLFLRDTCDVILEITKFSMCFRIQHGHVIKFYENCVKFFMTLLAVVFVINQLYYYPLVCLYHMINFIRVNNLNSPIWVGIVTCGWLFLLIDLFWFMVGR